MKLFHRVRLRLRALLNKSKFDKQMDEEMRSHVEMQTQENIDAGMKPEEARFSAMRQFGWSELIKEDCRERCGVRWLENLFQDIRYGARQLRKNPGFTTVAVLTLALGIGAGTSVFSLFNAVLLRSLPVPNPNELRVLQWSGTDSRVPSLVGNIVNDGNRVIADRVSPPIFTSLREQAADVADVFGLAETEAFPVDIRGRTIIAKGMVVSDNFFSSLGVNAMMGRVFGVGQGEVGARQGVVISWEWWQKHFDGDPEAIGKSVTLKGQSFDIIGVLPRGFQGVRPGVPTEFYGLLTPGSPLLDGALTNGRHWWLSLMARVRSGVNDNQLRTALSGIFAREAGELMTAPRIVVESGRSGLLLDRNNYRKSLFLMLGIVGIVMLVACINLAGLTLARNASRRHEVAIRTALGAGRWRCVRQSLAESFLLSLAGGGLAVIGAIWGRAVLSRLLFGSVQELHFDLSTDLLVLGFALTCVLITAVLSGVLPAAWASRVDPAGALKTRGALNSSRLRSGRFLVAAQISLSLPLIAGAGLYLRTIVNLNKVDAGFKTEKLLVFQLRAADAGYEGVRLAGYYERLQNALAALPGVSGAALIHYPLLGNQSSQGDFRLSSRPDSQPGELQTHRLLVSESFFATMGIPLLQGNVWRSGESNSVVVNEAFVKHITPNRDPIGQIMNIWGADWRIVGVCRDIKHRNIKEPTPPTTYFSFVGRIPPTTSFVVRTTLPALTLANAVGDTVVRIDPAVPAINLTTQDLVREGTISQERLFAILGGALGALALLLSCLGLYGLMAYNVTRRRSEIAIRMAIGAQRSDVARSVLREALGLTMIGGLVGIPAVLAVTRFLKSQLFGVEPNDPMTLSVAMIALVSVALAAAWLPAWRATRVDPLAALRTE